MGLHLGNKGGEKAESDHKIIGYTVVGAAILQMVFGMARVKKGARWRLQWSWVHRSGSEALDSLRPSDAH